MKRLIVIFTSCTLLFTQLFAQDYFNTGGNFDKMAKLAENLKSLAFISFLDDHIKECSHLVEAVLKEQQNNLTLDQIKHLNQQIVASIDRIQEEMDAAHPALINGTDFHHYLFDPAFQKKIKEACAKYRIHHLYPSSIMNDGTILIDINDDAFNKCYMKMLSANPTPKDQETLELIKTLEVITKQNMENDLNEVQAELIILEIQKECAKHGMHVTIEDKEHGADPCDADDKALIECLIKLYSSDLLSKAEEELKELPNLFEKEEL